MTTQDAGAPRTVGQILSAEQLAVLRSGYRNDDMLQLARTIAAGSFAGALPMQQLVAAKFFAGDGFNLADTALTGPPSTVISPKERESVIIALMTARLADPMFLAIHIYWGLMEGLHPEQIAWIQHLTGTYSGIDLFSRGINILNRTLCGLQACLPDNDLDSVLASLRRHVC